MRTFNIEIHYAGPAGRQRREQFLGITSATVADAKEQARTQFFVRRSKPSNNLAVATIVGITATEVNTPTWTTPNAAPQVDVLDQIKALVGTPVVDPRIGKVVNKTSGDYQFDGVVVGIIIKLSGAERFVVEDSRGLLLIMNAGQVGL